LTTTPLTDVDERHDATRGDTKEGLMTNSMRTLGMFLVAAAALSLVACEEKRGGPGPGVDAGSGGGTDAGPGVDAGPGAVACAIPDDGFGTDTGRKLRAFSLNECDGTPFTFYDDEFCSAEHRLSVISIAAGWCVPCQHESAQLKARVQDIYEPRGVRVIQVLVQDEARRPPTASFCDGWVRRYGLTNTELLDPAQITNIYFPDNSLPSTIIVDRTGTIRFRENGATDGLVTLTAALDALLAE
jgi:Redoxin